MKRLTWFEASKLANGTRIVFAEPHDIFPEALVEAGTTATVKENDLNENSACMYVVPDNANLRAALVEWDGEIMLHPNLSSALGNREWSEFSPISILES